MTEPEYVADTLAWCNEQRALRQMEPLERLPKGRKHDPFSCPCGKASGMNVGSLEYGQRLPEPVREFVHAFDSGMLPQYDEDPGRDDDEKPE